MRHRSTYANLRTDMSLVFERDKYLQIVKTQGLTTAVSTLHHDLWETEYRCFESQTGYDPVIWKQLNEMRQFSRELWDMKFKTNSK